MDMTPERLACLKAVKAAGGRLNHEDPVLTPFLDDASTLSNPDVFNQCHDADWLVTSFDDRTDDCYAHLTDAGRAALASQ